MSARRRWLLLAGQAGLATAALPGLAALAALDVGTAETKLADSTAADAAAAAAAAAVAAAKAALAAPAAPAADQRAHPAGADRPAEDRITPGRALAFPRDHGAHPGARIEWWYATGWLQGAAPGAGLIGFQLTFFRSRTGLAQALPGRFAPRQLLFAHAAVSDIAGKKHRHAQRISRWSGDETLADAHALRADTAVALGRWTLRRQPDGGYRALLAAPEAAFTLDLHLQASQPLLLQGQAGYSRKGPAPGQASHYYSVPQLVVSAQLALDGKRQPLAGRGWLDHEWSDDLLASGDNRADVANGANRANAASGGNRANVANVANGGNRANRASGDNRADTATGWDWIGINLADGGALTAFVLRRADASVLWAGGSHRPAGGAVHDFLPGDVVFTPLRDWASPATGVRYPVQWRIRCPAGSFELRALLDAQELDGSASTGLVYWEGLAELLGADGARVGLGYLEMTGRGRPLRLGLW